MPEARSADVQMSVETVISGTPQRGGTLERGLLVAKDQSAPPPAEELSRGELRVLRYLPTNLSRSEMAGELSVSPNTVSTHIRSTYAKLRAADRSAAVRRARELRLLAADRNAGRASRSR